METVINSVAKFLRDKSISTKIKILRVILIFIILLGVNDYLGFTYYYNAGKKVNLIEKIEKAKTSKEISAKHKKKLNNLEDEIINRKNVFSRSSDYLSQQWFSKKQVNPKPKKERSLLMHILSSSVVWIVLFLFVFVAVFVDKDDKDSETILGIIIGLILLALLAFFFQWVLGLIPVIFGNSTYNYILNSIIQISVATLVIWLFNKYVDEEDDNEIKC